uniref:Ribonuclease H-like domain-containing protein n=1 Tax=Tanacetum cinerariifolium TaxID=118510 RepID=A0A699KPJ4_TANCI|nr:ribonuclease H-like domain-containing protein [Tanacetum cinerariifolium]
MSVFLICSNPNDGERDSYAPNDEGNVYPCTRSLQTSDGSEDNIANFMGDNIPSEGTILSSFSSGLNTHDLPDNGSQVQPAARRSSRPSKMPPKFNDYLVGSNVKYGPKKYVSYANLNSSNYCLSTNLNTSCEPNTYYEAVKNTKWIEAMNNEIKALNRNDTWTICDLPK